MTFKSSPEFSSANVFDSIYTNGDFIVLKRKGHKQTNSHILCHAYVIVFVLGKVLGGTLPDIDSLGVILGATQFPCCKGLAGVVVALCWVQVALLLGVAFDSTSTALPFLG